VLQGPGGLDVGGGGDGSGWWYGARATDPASAVAPAWLRRGPTRLTVTIKRPATPLQPGSQVFDIDCSDAANSLTPRCPQILRERAALFSPVQSDNSCHGGLTPESEVSGTVGGIPIHRSYSNCYGGVTGRWMALLHVR
jgi:hypothetical protein